jgi:hypothetical protein
MLIRRVANTSSVVVDVIRIRAFCRGSTLAFDASSLYFLPPRRRFGFRWFFPVMSSRRSLRINFVFQEQSFARVAQHVLSEWVERAQSLL